MSKIFIILSLICIVTKMANSNPLNSTTIVGGIGEEISSKETDEVLKVLKENVKLMKDENKKDVSLKVVKITSAKKQIVSGNLYHIYGIFEGANGEQFNCYVTVWDQSWVIPRYQITVKTSEKISGTSSASGTNAKTFLALFSLLAFTLTKF